MISAPIDNSNVPILESDPMFTNDDLSSTINRSKEIDSDEVDEFGENGSLVVEDIAKLKKKRERRIYPEPTRTYDLRSAKSSYDFYN